MKTKKKSEKEVFFSFIQQGCTRFLSFPSNFFSFFFQKDIRWTGDVLALTEFFFLSSSKRKRIKRKERGDESMRNVRLSIRSISARPINKTAPKRPHRRRKSVPSACVLVCVCVSVFVSVCVTIPFRS